MRKRILLPSDSDKPEALLTEDLPLLRTVASGGARGLVQAALDPFALTHLTRLAYVEVRSGRAYVTSAGRARLARS